MLYIPHVNADELLHNTTINAPFSCAQNAFFAKEQYLQTPSIHNLIYFNEIQKSYSAHSHNKRTSTVFFLALQNYTILMMTIYIMLVFQTPVISHQKIILIQAFMNLPIAVVHLKFILLKLVPLYSP